MASATGNRFRPSLWGSIGLVVGLVIFCAAGVWQLKRAEEKQQLFSAFEQSDDDDTLRDLVADRDAQQYLYRHFSITGRYDPDHQILLDNMVHDSRAGYHVLTPIKFGATAVLVNRGWLLANPDRRVLPDITVTNNTRTVNGRLYRLPRAGYTLDNAAPASDATWPRRMSFPSIEEIIDQVGFPLHDYQLLLDPDASDGYERTWQPALMRPEKHLAYAIQWFMMAIAITIIYVMLTIRAARTGKADA